MTPVELANVVLCNSEPPFLKHYRRGRFAHSRGVSFTGSVLPGPGFNFAACTRETPTLAEVASMAKAFYDDPADAWGVLVQGDASHPIETELKAHGWTVAEDEPAYVLNDLARFASEQRATVLVIRPLVDEADWASFVQTTCSAYGAPPEFGDMIMPTLAYALDPEMIWLLAEKDGEIVSAGGGYRIGSSAVVCCLATPSEHRGSGIGTAVMRDLLRRFAETGSTTAVLRSGPLSRPLYERLGFEYVCQHRTYVAPV